MKKILSLLMCYVFLQAETFALRGGPTGGGSGKVTGSFSGVMLEKPDPADPAKISSDIGLFIMSAAISGPSVGYLIIFSPDCPIPPEGVPEPSTVYSREPPPPAHLPPPQQAAV
jgi:hypothetical protein